jgi:Family of unknown function (DUF6328)
VQALEEIGVNGRSETALERCDRNLVELLQEVRVAQTGVQILFAVLLSVPFTARFERLSSFQEITYFGTLLAAGAAALLLIAPTSHHRVVFRLGDKEHLVRTANRLTIFGLGFVALALVGAILLISDLLFPGVVAVCTTSAAVVTCLITWYALPLRRRRRLRAQAAAAALPPRRTDHRGAPHPARRPRADSA